MKRLALALLLVLFLAASAYAVVPPSCSESVAFHGDKGQIKIAWTSAGDGTFECITQNLYLFVYQLDTLPNGGGTQPDNLYDIVVTNYETGAPIDGGALQNRSNTSVESVFPLVNGSAGSPMTFGRIKVAITNAGAAKTGTLYLNVMQ